jgi:hypothetical protein
LAGRCPEGTYSQCGRDSQIERIRKILEKEEKIRLEEVRSYLVLLQANSVKPLVKLLGELKNSKSRRTICDAIAESGKNSIDLFVPFLDDRRWYLPEISPTSWSSREGAGLSLPA